MPYRSTHIQTTMKAAETFIVRIPDTAIAAWLLERDELRSRGYPDRPPDVDQATLRAWLARPGEERLRYFLDHAEAPSQASFTDTFPVYLAVWSSPYGTARVMVTGHASGDFENRVTVINRDGRCPVDAARAIASDLAPDVVWTEIEAVVARINEAGAGWGPEDPLVTTYTDFLAFDAEVRVAEAEARAAGLLAPVWVH
jgi:hypothetical protein